MRRVIAVCLAGLAIAAITLGLSRHDALAPRDVIRPAQRQIADGRIDLLVIGTSLSHRALWPERLAGRRLDCGWIIESVHVVAQPGANVSRAGALIAESVARTGGGVDIAVMEFAINDADLFDGLSRRQAWNAWISAITQLREAYPDIAVILMTTNPVRGLQELKRPLLSRHYSDLVEIARETGASLFDGEARWSYHPLDEATLPDGLHPDPAIEADLYEAGLIGLIEDVFQEACESPTRF
ncbi:GDSL-like lipase/acylhydrolase family protein [Albidovulum inexpectatum]|uniref:GDSL-like lipase/acylhydrolase family protein n=1 Tax=Albidovulum inexpectatum TaxID=196587 RepID=A0A2S5JDV3_9RHOB|nr:SGNH/GDSL hydrolase family protein [Albidovulum inexpectatum]PPB79667.1 GDSL-like lipase/acylhydrolase family protein [Albidovulum inexpectatum]